MPTTTECACPQCSGPVRFPYDQRRRASGHRFGSCDRCGALLTRYAGQVWPVAALQGAAVLTALSTMLPFTLLAAHRLYKRPP